MRVFSSILFCFCLPMLVGCASDSKVKVRSAESDQVMASAETNPDMVAESQALGSEATEEERKTNLRRPASEILLAEDTVFALQFAQSEPGERAEEACDQKYRDNPQKYNQCMRDHARKIKGDILSFKKELDGSWVWTTSHKQGSTLRKISSVKFEVAEEKGNIVKLKLLRGSQGTVEIEVPNDYSIVVPHPVHGKLVYEAKIGIVGTGE